MTAPDEIGVILQIGKGDRIYYVMGFLAEEGDQVFAERLWTNEATLLPLPQRLRLNPTHLSVIQEREAGRPETRFYRAIVPVA